MIDRTSLSYSDEDKKATFKSPKTMVDAGWCWGPAGTLHGSGGAPRLAGMVIRVRRNRVRVRVEGLG
jgi:hypothetical protein